MTISATFVLGKKESYFFNTPTHWAWHNLPADIEALFTQSPAIKDVVELALGANGTYFVSYRDEFSQILCKHYNLPNALTSWLYCSHPSIIRDLATLSITLGPYDSYYAWDKTSASWSNLPPKLEKAILNRVESQDAWKTTWKAGGAEAPSFVSLGADEAYWMRTVSGGGCWDLKCSAPPSNPGATDGMAGLRGTNKFLEDSADFNGVAALHLFPSHADAYILITTAGKAFSNLPEFTWPDYNKMAPALPSFVQGMAPLPPMPMARQQVSTQTPVQPQPQQIAQPQVQYQQPYQVQRQGYNCCPPNAAAVQYGTPAYGAPQGQQFGSTGQMFAGQQGGYTGGGNAAGPVHR